MLLDYMVNHCRLTCTVIAFQAMGGGPGSNAKVFANGLAKNAHKAAKDSTEHTQAEPSKAAEQRHTISQMLKDRTTKALHLLRSMQVETNSSMENSWSTCLHLHI